MNRSLIHCLFIIILAAVLVLGPIYLLADDLITPIDEIKTEELRIVDGANYCWAGYGAKHLLFQFGGKNTGTGTSNSGLIPPTNLHQSPYSGIGCSMNDIYIQYSLHDYSSKLDSSVTFEGKDYNAIEYTFSSLTLGYKLPIISHKLLFGFGIGYDYLQYKLGQYSASEEYKSDSLNDSNLNGAIKLEYYFSSFAFIEWALSKSFNSEGIVRQTNQLGLSIYVKL